MLTNGFKVYLQFCTSFRRQLLGPAAGTKVLATNRTHVATAEFRLPSLAGQRAIAAIFSDMDAKIAALEFRFDKTRTIKQGMMQQLPTGPIRLSIANADAADKPAQ